MPAIRRAAKDVSRAANNVSYTTFKVNDLIDDTKDGVGVDFIVDREALREMIVEEYQDFMEFLKTGTWPDIKEGEEFWQLPATAVVNFAVDANRID